MLTHKTPNGSWKIHVRFPTAQEVYLLGEFNNWSTTATPLVSLGEGMWEVTVGMGTGLKRLCFFVWEHGQRFGRVFEHDGEPATDLPDRDPGQAAMA